MTLNCKKCKNLHGGLKLAPLKCRRVGPYQSLEEHFDPPRQRTHRLVALVPRHQGDFRPRLGPQEHNNPGRLAQSVPLNHLPPLLVTTQSCPPAQSQLWRPFSLVDRLTDFAELANLYKR